MHIAMVAALVAVAPAASGDQALFPPGQSAAVSERVRTACGYATAGELKLLAEGARGAALQCFVRITAKETNGLLPKEIEPAVVVKSAIVAEETLLVLTLQLGPEPARAMAADGRKLANRLADQSCQDPPLVRLIDAGGALVYRYQDDKGADLGLSLDAITECRSPMR